MKDGEKYKVLVKRGGGRGDVLLSTSVLRALKAKFPQSFLGMATDISGVDIVKGLPYIDKLYICNNFYEVLDFHEPGYDLVVSLLYEKQLHLPYLEAFMGQAGVVGYQPRPVILWNAKVENYARRLVGSFNPEGRPLIALHRGPTWPMRMWRDEGYEKVLKHFKQKYRAAIIEVSGTPGYNLGLGLDLTGQCNFKTTAAILKRCSALLCIDSLVMHMASAVCLPAVGLFGPTDPKKVMLADGLNYPVVTPSPCRFCRHLRGTSVYIECTQKSYVCMEKIQPEQVIEGLEKVLRKTGAV
ncbi:MAG: glycosyltransferase family 9 protein [Clostridia bacterium]|nr:glycosyltransferase family 9 protein [Clostridia bacterium]